MTAIILAIDLGTSATKLLAVTCEGEVVARERLSHETHHPEPGAAEQDATAWWRNLGLGVRDIMSRIEGDVAAIAVTGQMHGLVVHGDEGQPLRPAIIWQDSRSASTLPELLDGIGADPDTIAAGYQAASWHWLARTAPDCATAARRILLPKDEIVYRHTGEHVTDPSDAVGTGWFDPIRGEWDRRIVEAAGASIELLPTIVPSGSVAGNLSLTAAEHLALDPGVPVIVAGGDASVGAFGAGATRQETPLLMLSTGCQVLYPTDAPPNDKPSGWRLWPAATVTGLAPWLKVGATLNGGSAINWARAAFGDAEAAWPARDNDPVFVPYLNGERFPVVRSGAAGAFFELGPSHDRAALLRAAIDGVALSTADALVSMEGRISTDAPLLIGGGGIRDEAWVEAISYAFDRPLRIVTEPDLSAWGAARLAASQLGWIDPTAEPETWLPEMRSIDRPSAQNGKAGDRLCRYQRLARLVARQTSGTES